jgi:hydrogenase expression/formation protein HypD
MAARYHVPIVVTGFEPVDLLEGIWRAVRQLEEGRAEVENQYCRLVRPCGNPAARAAIEAVFEIVDFPWRGIGKIPASGMALGSRYRRFDARLRFAGEVLPGVEPPACRSGEVLAGRLKPSDCAAFGTLCNPDHPLGATMVSAEGACAAYYRYRRPQPSEAAIA